MKLLFHLNEEIQEWGSKFIYFQTFKEKSIIKLYKNLRENFLTPPDLFTITLIQKETITFPI